MENRLRLSVVVACLVLPLAACGGEDGGGTAQTAPSAAVTAAAPTGTAAPTTENSQAADTEDAQVVSITVTGGKATGDTGRTAVKLGERVRLTVLADVADEVHVHGYDLTQATEAGSPVNLEFVADRPGVFEVELEQAGVVLTRLQVQ